MQGSFEQKVQETMAGFQLDPSVPVWENIERRITPNKKRRRVVFWFFLGMLLAGVAGWWLQSSNRLPEARPAVQSKTINQRPAGVPGRLAGADRRQQPSGVPGATASLVSEAAPPVIKNREPHSIVPGQTFSMPVKNLRKKEVTAALEQALNETVEIIGQPLNRESGLSLSGHPDSTKTKATESSLPEPAPTASVPVAAKKSDLKEWRSEILFAVGWSHATGAAMGTLAVAAPVYSGPPGNAGSLTPQPMTGGFSFTVGYARTKRLSPRLAFSAGLQYAYYSTHQMVGSFKALDTSLRYQNTTYGVNGYYNRIAAPGAQQVSYTYRFQLLELPVQLQCRLFGKLPLQLSE